MMKALIAAIAMTAALATPAAATDCFDIAADYYDVDANLLRTIAAVESGGNPNAVNINTDGSRDIGLMQINDWWLGPLKQYGYTEAHLYDACTSISIGAWVLAQEIATHGANWKAVGAYNAKSPDKARAYAKRVWKRYTKQYAQTKTPETKTPDTQ